MSRSTVRRTVLALVVAVATVPAVASQQAAGQKAKASDLIHDAQVAVGVVVKAGRDLPRLAPEKAEAKPFWEAMKTLNESLAKAETGLSLKDGTFFAMVAASHAAVEQAEIALTMSGASSAALDRSMKSLGAVVTALDENYSKEAARLKQGGELTASERKQLDELKARQDELEKKLDLIDKKAGKNAKAIRKGTNEIRKQSQRIRNARYTTVDFVAAMTASRMMAGSIWGWHWWWGPWGYWGPGWINVDIIIWDDWIDAVPYDWAIADTYLDIGDLGLEAMPFDDGALEATAHWLDSHDFAMDDADFEAVTLDLDGGWDDVHTDAGLEVLHAMESSFDDMPFEPDFDVPTFDDFDFGDFGGDFGYDW